MENPPFEDVFPIKDGDIPASEILVYQIGKTSTCQGIFDPLKPVKPSGWVFFKIPARIKNYLPWCWWDSYCERRLLEVLKLTVELMMTFFLGGHAKKLLWEVSG